MPPIFKIILKIYGFVKVIKSTFFEQKLSYLIIFNTNNNIGDKSMKIKIRYEEEEEKDNLIRNKNYIGIYILGIRIKKIKLRRKVHGENVFGKNVNIIYMIVKQVIKSYK